LLQPSPEIALPSSQASAPTASAPSPQVLVQALGEPVHTQPFSSAQVGLQPS
jgi:hypothetical protein